MQAKYYNKITIVDEIRFHSKKEAKRYSELLLLQKAGEISFLELQYPFDFAIDGKRIFTYVCDFTYRNKQGEMVVEDVKGFRTPVYRLKKKLIEAYYKIKIWEL
ncbi:MAG: DUF1064 domain-containing protein [Nitrospira sp.]|nr:DUF1064 domain-containing protein [Nitrospira sp.]